MWLGGSAFANLILLPYIAARPMSEQRELVRQLLIGPERLMIGGAVTAAVLGLVLGIASGRIRSVDGLTSAYGLVWLASILVAVLVFATGGLVTSPVARRLERDDDLWHQGPVGSPSAARSDAFRRLRFGFGTELAGIAVILALMVVLGRLSGRSPP